ncbi:hypothetical protein CQ059_22420 [Brucella pseudogrignonensis]|nr:DUF1173 family protein [Ochrobactrum sp. MYb237]PQZ39571.1 hypothetical protein CQ059_22420 [Brucella pseudogrignonensis]PRA41239.1 hypothetical protein CQ063_11615 [Brucella pseudogrignonensis]PRA70064.1 hypothetical protein CQ055_11500 [Brucella pseudogrignonensis]
MEGRRHWCTPRNRLREETTPLHVKAQPLFDRLCIRQTFRHQQEQEISRREERFCNSSPPSGDWDGINSYDCHRRNHAAECRLYRNPGEYIC